MHSLKLKASKDPVIFEKPNNSLKLNLIYAMKMATHTNGKKNRSALTVLLPCST